MPVRRDLRHEARYVAQRIVESFGQELRTARLGAGLSQRSAGAAAGISHAHWGRIERGRVPNLSLVLACTVAAIVGLRLSVRAYLDGDPVRDAGQAAQLERFRLRLPTSAGWQTEVPMPIPAIAARRTSGRD